MLKKSSLLKQVGQMEPNLAGSVYVRSKPGIDGPWVPFKIVSDSPTLHSRWLLFFKVMIISLWNFLQYHSIVRWAIQAQWPEPLVNFHINLFYFAIFFNYYIIIFSTMHTFFFAMLVQKWHT
jgi:hypothetical protein